MFFFLYDCLVLALTVFFLPAFLWRRIFQGKFKGCLGQYLGFTLPKVLPKKGRTFVFYAVSMGETKAGISLLRVFKSHHPDDRFYMVSRTETGLAESKKSFPEADGHFLLPLDFSWCMKRFIKQLEPDVVVVIENDFWMNFLREAKKQGAFVALASGRVSARSFQSFKKFPWFSQKLFSFFDLLCVQNELFKDRFTALGVFPDKVLVTGNLKFDIPKLPTGAKALKEKLGLVHASHILVIGSTHAHEEEAILELLRPLWKEMPSLVAIVVPRHPERFSQVEKMLLEKGYSMVSYSRIQEKTGKEEVILIDAMGLLLSLYQMADLAIVGGSFFSHLKGHNILEPIQAGTVPIFGPYMSDQEDLVSWVLTAESGIQTSLEDLKGEVSLLLQDAFLRRALQEKGKALSLHIQGVTARTQQAIFDNFSRKEKEMVEV